MIFWNAEIPDGPPAAIDVRVIQSHRSPPPADWYALCVESVRAWCHSRNFEHVWLGDELFDPVPADIRAATVDQPVVTADLARLYALESALRDGVDIAVWLDADVLVIAPDALEVPAADFAFGREVWIQSGRHEALRAYRRIHNAFISCRQGNPLLAFYRYAAERMILRHDGPMVPQFIGPKFLTVLDNILRFPVLESVGMLCPMVINDLLSGGGRALTAFRSTVTVAPAAVNVCGSMVAAGEVTDAQIAQAFQLLVEEPALLNPSARGAAR